MESDVAIHPYVHMISGVCKQYRPPKKKKHVHRENDEGHSTPRPDKTKWKYVEQNE